MRIKPKLNILIDAIMFLIIIPVFIIRGKEIHEVLAYLFGMLLVIHIILHWKQIELLVRNLIPNSKIRLTAIVIFCLLCIYLAFVSFQISESHTKERWRWRGQSSINQELNPCPSVSINC
jgi:hypothetical protein